MNKEKSGEENDVKFECMDGYVYVSIFQIFVYCPSTLIANRWALFISYVYISIFHIFDDKKECNERRFETKFGLFLVSEII